VCRRVPNLLEGARHRTADAPAAGPFGEQRKGDHHRAEGRQNGEDRQQVGHPRSLFAGDDVLRRPSIQGSGLAPGARAKGALIKAANAAPLSASARSAVNGAALKTFRGLGLGDSGLGTKISTIYSRIDAAARGLAVCDALTPEQLRVLLAPFIALGFQSVSDPTEPSGARQPP